MENISALRRNYCENIDLINYHKPPSTHMGSGTSSTISQPATGSSNSFLFILSFSLYFLVTVAMTEAAAFTFLMGQLVDSICTPLVGYFSDRWSSRYGQRTPWYCVGYFIVIMTFPFIFRVYRSTPGWEMFYYGTFASLFNVGWAFCQISHMSLVPSISCSKSRK